MPDDYSRPKDIIDYIKMLNKRVRRLERPWADSWHTCGNSGEPPMANGWAVTTDPVGFIKIRDIVYLRGRTNSGTDGTIAFTLPVGYRPIVNLQPIMCYAAGTPFTASANIGLGGGVSLNWRAGSTSSITLSGISFPTI